MSISKKYVLLTLKNGSISFASIEKNVCFVSSLLLDLINNNIIEIEDKKIKICKDLPESLSYIEPVYEMLKNRENKNKKNTLKKIITKYSTSYSKFRNLRNNIFNVLLEENLVKKEKNKIYFINDTSHEVIQETKDNFLSNQNISLENVGILVLLKESKQLKKYFTKDEINEIKSKLNVIEMDKEYAFINEIIKCIQGAIIAVIVGSGAV